jgi:hypothetical protein
VGQPDGPPPNSTSRASKRFFSPTALSLLFAFRTDEHDELNQAVGRLPAALRRWAFRLKIPKVMVYNAEGAEGKAETADPRL